VASAGPFASLHLAPDSQPYQHPTTQFFTGQMPFLPPNQQNQSNEGKGIAIEKCTQIPNSKSQIINMLWRLTIKQLLFRHSICCVRAASAVDSSHITASSSASRSRFSPFSDSVNGHMSTMWFMVCHWPQSQEGERARPNLCKLAWHGPWPVQKRFIRDHRDGYRW